MTPLNVTDVTNEAPSSGVKLEKKTYLKSAASASSCGTSPWSSAALKSWWLALPWHPEHSSVARLKYDDTLKVAKLPSNSQVLACVTILWT